MPVDLRSTGERSQALITTDSSEWMNPPAPVHARARHASNNVDPLVSGFGQIYLTVKYICPVVLLSVDDVFYLFLQKQKIGAELHIYLEEGTYHKRLFRGPNTNDMKK